MREGWFHHVLNWAPIGPLFLLTGHFLFSFLNLIKVSNLAIVIHHLVVPRGAHTTAARYHHQSPIGVQITAAATLNVLFFPVSQNFNTRILRSESALSTLIFSIHSVRDLI